MSTVFERFLLAKLVERERERPGVKILLRKFSSDVGIPGSREAKVTTSTLLGLVGKGLVSTSGLHGRFIRSTADGRLLAELHGNTTGENIDVSAPLPKPAKSLAQSLLEASGKMRAGASGAPKAAAKASPKATPAPKAAKAAKPKAKPKAPERSMADQLSSLEPEVSQGRGRASRVHSASAVIKTPSPAASLPVTPEPAPAPVTPAAVEDATPVAVADATIPLPVSLSEWIAAADDLESAEVVETPLAKADPLPPRGLLRGTPEDRLAVLSYALENLNPELELMVLIAHEKRTPGATREALRLAAIAQSLSHLWDDLGAEIAASESHRKAAGE